MQNKDAVKTESVLKTPSKKQSYLKSLAFFIISLVLLWGVVVWVLLKSNSNSCSEKYRDDTQITVNNNKVVAQVAKTRSEQEQGLSGKSCIGANQGMLFVFDKSDYYGFWMKDMKFPIDMIWINSDHKVVTIQSNVAPKTYPKSFNSNKPAQYVLELKAGQAVKLGIKQNTVLSF